MLVLVLLLAVIALAYFYFTYNFSYWKNKGVTYLKPYPILGSMVKVLTLQQHVTKFYQETYKKHRNEPFLGYFQGRKPALIVNDPELLKRIVIKDFTHFTDHGFQIDEEVEPLQGKSLFNLAGQRWKEMRAKLSPTFTSGRMKSMFPLVLECGNILEKYYGSVSDSNVDIDVKDLFSRYTTDVISSCVFGVRCDSINDPQAHFRVMGRRILDVDFVQGIKRAFMIFVPEIAKRLKFRFFDDTVLNFFRSLVNDVMLMRKTTGEIRNDFMQLLIQLKEKGRLVPQEDEKECELAEETNLSKLTDDDVTAQAMVFFTAGFETSASTLSFAIFELSHRPELQQRARENIEQVLQKHDGELTYQALQDMTYLDWIIQETLRKYPPTTILTRVCTKSYVLPGTKIVIDKNTLITVPIQALQNDPKYFPDPETFDPERFNDEEQKNQSVYMPFGDGPRMCIGLRFARMQSKVALVMLLRKFEFKPSRNCPTKLEWIPRQFFLSPKEKVMIRINQI